MQKIKYLLAGCILALAGFIIVAPAQAYITLDRPMREIRTPRVPREPRQPRPLPVRDLIGRICDHLDDRFFTPFNICEPPLPEPFCGDGIVNLPSEECDMNAGVGEHQACTDQCLLEDVPYCGDGVVNQEGEQCDGEAGVGEHQGCNEFCVLEDLSYCGDGVINQEEEQCDGADGVGEGQLCNDQCLLEDMPLTGTARVVINEFLANPSVDQGADDNEWVELYNAGDAAADLTGWSMNDAAGSAVTLPGSPILAPGEFLLITSSEELDAFWTLPEGAQVITMNIGALNNGEGDKVILFDNASAVIDQVSYGDNVDAFDPSLGLPVDGQSFSRSPNGTDTDTAADWTALETPTPGS